MSGGFNRIGLVGRIGNTSVIDSVGLVERCLTDAGREVVLEHETASMLNGHGHEVLPRTRLGDVCDLLVVVGGDGSILGVARELAHTRTPVLGVNRGGLGFLAGISPDQIERKLSEVLAGEYTLEERALLSATVSRGDEQFAASTALNDVVVHAGSTSRMMDFRLYVNDEFVYEQRSDGLIVASPTGSTAYALSAGGPIMHPELDALVIVPMFPHTLTSRPLVVRGDAALKIVVGRSGGTPQVSCDSQVDVIVREGDTVRISKNPAFLSLMFPTGHNFYESCRSKLDWASRLGSR